MENLRGSTAKTILAACLYSYPGFTNLSTSVEKAQKILSPVPYEKGFHFFAPDGHYSGETAMSLCFFLRDLEHVDMQSIRFHFERCDFQKWLRTTMGDEELAQRIDILDKSTPNEKLRQKLIDSVQERISELQLIGT